MTVPVSYAAAYPHTASINCCTREDLAGMACEEGEQVELLCRQAHWPAGDEHITRRVVELELVEHEATFADRLGRRTPQHGSHARRELSRRERLRHVVVCAELEADDAIGFLRTRGEHDHGQLAIRADLAAEVETVAAGKHQVENDQAGRVLQQSRSRRREVRRFHGLVAVALEVAHDHLTHDRLVVDDEDGGHPASGYRRRAQTETSIHERVKDSRKNFATSGGENGRDVSEGGSTMRRNSDAPCESQRWPPPRRLPPRAAGSGGVTGPAFYVDGQLYRTVNTPTDLSDTGAPDHSFDTIYDFGGLQPNVATAAPGDHGYNGGRWRVHGLSFTNYPTAVQQFDSNGSGDLDSASEVQAALAAGAATDVGIVKSFVCPVIPLH